MLTVSYTAGEHLDLMLAAAAEADDIPDDAVIRLALEVEGFSLGIDIVRPGDTTFDHGGKVVLVIDEQASELLADRNLDVKVTGVESHLVLTEQLGE